MSPQHSSHENCSDMSVLSVISNFFLFLRIITFFILVSQALALGDKQVKYFFSLNSLTPRVCHTLSSNNIFSTFFFCCQFCVFLTASPLKNINICVYQVQQNCSMLPCYHCASGFICPFLSWSHQQLLLTFLQELPSDISGNFLLHFARQVPQ